MADLGQVSAGEALRRLREEVDVDVLPQPAAQPCACVRACVCVCARARACALATGDLRRLALRIEWRDGWSGSGM